MRTIEEKLQEHKQNMNTIQAPPELESRLRQALQQAPVKKRRKPRAVALAAAIAAAVVLLAGSYQYPAFAYYGGKLLSSIELSSLSFSDVMEQGYGQKVGKSKTLDDGTVITVEGVIADENALLVYYTIDLPEGSVFNVDENNRFGLDYLHSFRSDSFVKEGSGDYSEDKTRFEGMSKFEPVSPFSRTLTVTFSEWKDKERLTYPISFKYDANKAMNSIIKEKLTASVPVDQGNVCYDSITASPTSTIIKGHYELDTGELPRFMGKTKLYVNGVELGFRGGRSTKKGDKPGFELEFEVLPTEKVDSMQIVLDDFSGYQKVDQPISLASPSDRSIRIGTEKLWIRSVTKTTNGYDIVIARKQFTMLDYDTIAVQAGGAKVPAAAISQARPWDLKNGNIMWEQTFTFKTDAKPESLLLDGFDYIKTYNQTITIPLKPSV
ncbi:hypothetical protein PCCS19_26900 [Paenibacillus sp. CCS19]|uniref:DUF4179 domain-containing protein n=1 Tax=Paenibacillus sp. CCS19 TaxID=3158387 RepID=UPI0025695BEA|nr:DUF4179 domain-containing protein [Paenibacillus cellulosilyticus]GMK39636.1 hypothetical protein PCCS19_26900 [Paenibacillus cellulosilyticus]